MQVFRNFRSENFHTFLLFSHRRDAKIILNNVFITKYGPSMGSCDKNAVMVTIAFHQLQREQTEKMQEVT